MMTENLVGFIAWLGGACFCGFLPLGFALILFFISRKRKQVSAEVGTSRMMAIASLQPGLDLVRVQGRITPSENPIDGSTENALVYLRMKVESYERGEESSGWRGLTDQSRSVPFQLDDGSGVVWVNPDGIDKQLVGKGFSPNDDQIQAASILLGISPGTLRGKLRFEVWEIRSGQTISVVGVVSSGKNGLEIAKGHNQPFIISMLLGQEVVSKINTQSKLAQTWMYILGIPGILFVICGLGGALISLIRILMGH
jgi:hypothetical protein